MAFFHRTRSLEPLEPARQAKARGESGHCGRAVLLFFIVSAWTSSGFAETFVVTNVQDAGSGSLRQAIEDANDSGLEPHEIRFAIPGVGPHTIQPETVLADVVRSTVIDGLSQPGAAPNTLDLGTNADLRVVLDGSLLASAGPPPTMFNLVGSDSRVQGLVVQNLEGTAIRLLGVRGSVQGCFLGTDVTGTVANGNTQGIAIVGDSQLVGGPLLAHRNLISGNGNAMALFSSNNAILNNTIGPDRSGIIPLRGGNGIVSQSSGPAVANNNIIGELDLGNVISGLGFGNAIEITSFNGAITQGTTVQGNFIGLDRSGTIAVPNDGVSGGVSASTGVLVTADRTVIGGVQPGRGNTIGHNSLIGVSVFADFVAVVGNRIGVDLNGDPAPNQGAAVSISGSFNTVGGIDPGAGNILASSSGPNGYGVVINADLDDPESHGNRILGNSIFGNEVGGVDLLSLFEGEPDASEGPTPNDPLDLDRGTNGLQNYPTVTQYSVAQAGTRVVGYLKSAPSVTYRVEIFGSQECDPSDFGQGETVLASFVDTTDSTGRLDFDLQLPNMAPVVTATATDSIGSSSEFSRCVSMQGALEVPLSTGANIGLMVVLTILGCSRLSRGT